MNETAFTPINKLQVNIKKCRQIYLDFASKLIFNATDLDITFKHLTLPAVLCEITYKLPHRQTNQREYLTTESGSL